MRTKMMIVGAALIGSFAAGCSKDEPKAAAPAAPAAGAAPAARVMNTPGGRDDLIVWADAEPDSGPAPLTVKLSADPLGGMQNPVYTWEFGDGSPQAKGAEVTHTYTRPGSFTVLLTVTDDTGNSGTDKTQIDVE